MITELINLTNLIGLIEGGRIDHGHHNNSAGVALLETIVFDKAIKVATELVNLEETLTIVTADHAHTLTMSGYPDRGASILGYSNNYYTTLMYATGPGGDQKVNAKIDGIFYQNLAAVYLSGAAHSGEDVPLYAVGPMSYLFHGVQEQSYIAHVVSYSLCLGEYKVNCESSKPSRSSQLLKKSSVLKQFAGNSASKVSTKFNFQVLVLLAVLNYCKIMLS